MYIRSELPFLVPACDYEHCDIGLTCIPTFCVNIKPQELRTWRNTDTSTCHVYLTKHRYFFYTPNVPWAPCIQQNAVVVSSCLFTNSTGWYILLERLYRDCGIWTFHIGIQLKFCVSVGSVNVLLVVCIELHTTLYNPSQPHNEELPPLPFCTERSTYPRGFTGTLLVAFSLLGHSGLIYWRMLSLYPMCYLCAKWNGAFCVY